MQGVPPLTTPVQVQPAHEVGGGGPGPEAMPALAKAARPPCSPGFPPHRNSRELSWENSQLAPVLSVENSKLLQEPLLTHLICGLNLDLSVTKKDVYPVFVRPGNSSIFWCLIVLEWRPPGLICLQRRKRRPVRHNPTSDPHPMSSACPT